MTTFHETLDLINLVLKSTRKEVSKTLLAGLRNCRRSHPEFYDGVIQHQNLLSLTADQWLDFLIKVPHWRLLDEKSLTNKLSPNQQEILKKSID